MSEQILPAQPVTSSVRKAAPLMGVHVSSDPTQLDLGTSLTGTDQPKSEQPPERETRKPMAYPPQPPPAAFSPRLVPTPAMGAPWIAKTPTPAPGASMPGIQLPEIAKSEQPKSREWSKSPFSASSYEGMAASGSQGSGGGGNGELLQAIKQLTEAIGDLARDIQKGSGEVKPGHQPDGSFVPKGFDRPGKPDKPKVEKEKKEKANGMNPVLRFIRSAAGG